MRNTILLTGKNKTTVDDFFNQLAFEYALLTTSLRTDDLINHIEVYKPDLFIICLGDEDSREIQRFSELKRKLKKNDVQIALVGEEKECIGFEAATGIQACLRFIKPISILNIAAKLQVFFKNYNMEKAADGPRESELETALKRIEAAKAAEKEKTRRKHILIVDDEPLMLKTIQEQLTDKYDVATAISGKIAQKFLAKRGTDLILLDYEMPVEDGPTVMKAIREDSRYDNIPIIFLTGVTDKEKIRQVLALKPQGYILKPIDKEKLLNTIKEFI